MDDGLKQRLIGAIVLAAIAVLFLPSLFKQDSRRAVDMSSQIPPEPARATELLEVLEPEQPDNIPPAQSFEENYRHEVVESGNNEPVEPAPESETVEVDQPDSGSGGAVEEPESKRPALNAEGVPQAWSLQVASFQSGERAEALWQRLQEEGYPSYIREANTSQGTLHRVFVGPKVSKTQAQAEKRSIDERFDTEALIVEFKP